MQWFSSIFILSVALCAYLQHPAFSQVQFVEKPYLDTPGDIVSPVLVKDADLDGDNDLDLVVASLNKIVWYRNEGTGESFGEVIPVSEQMFLASDMQLADINGDGYTDIVVAVQDENRLIWYRNEDGAGTFSSSQTISSTLNNPYGVHATDFDQDNDLDILSVSTTDNHIVLIRNLDGAGSWGDMEVISSTINQPYYITSAFIDSDAFEDIVVASAQDARLGWLRNEGGESISNDYQIIAENYTIWEKPKVLDFDEDEDLDLFFPTRATRPVWFENTNGEGAFVARDYGLSFAPDYFTFGDIDNDIETDAVYSSTQNSIFWLETNSESQIIQLHTVDADDSDVNTGIPPRLLLSDLNGDGYSDIVAYSQSLDRVVWYMNTGQDSHFEQFVSKPVSKIAGLQTPFRIMAADLDEDMDLDVVASNRNQLVWYENENGKGQYGPQQLASDANVSQFIVMDYEMDGDQDIIGRIDKRSPLRQVNLLENLDDQSSFSVVLGQAIGEAEFLQSLISVDLNGDGYEDVIRSLATSSPQLQRGILITYNPNGNWAGDPEVILTEDLDPRFVSIEVSDIDNDADLDLVTGFAQEGIIGWYENRDGLFATRKTIAMQDSLWPGLIITADLDGDMDIDVISGSGLNATMAWYENLNGLGDFGPANLIDASYPSIAEGEAADLDRDGDMDIIAYNFRDEEALVWYENLDGAGTFGDRIVIRNNHVNGIVAKDLDQDLDTDILWFSSTFNLIGWYENVLHVSGTPGPGMSEEPSLSISPAFPNPFYDQARFTVSTTHSQHVTISVWNTLGQQVRLVYDGLLVANIIHPFVFTPEHLPAGLYMIRIEGESSTDRLSVFYLK